jgi:hypothetical protein
MTVVRAGAGKGDACGADRPVRAILSPRECAIFEICSTQMNRTFERNSSLKKCYRRVRKPFGLIGMLTANSMKTHLISLMVAAIFLVVAYLIVG